MNYQEFRAEDFAADDYFKEWVCLPNAESDAFWRLFLKDYPERYYHLHEGKILVEGLHQINNIEADELQVSRVWSRIEETVARGNNGTVRFWRQKRLIYQAAASVILILGIAWLWYGRDSSRSEAIGSKVQNSPAWQEATTQLGQTLQVRLSDGSRISLEENSKIRYSSEFSGDQREVYLSGAAFFEVTKNPSKPFLVYSNGLVTKVLGTSFHIQARDADPDVTVEVRTGRVSVYSGNVSNTQDPEANGIVLTPNQQAIFQKGVKTLSKTLVEKPTILIKKDELPSFIFEDASAADVFETLEKVYGINVVFDEELMKNCKLTINLDDEDLFQKLEVICKVLEVRYKLIDAQVIIYSKGC